MIINFWIYCIHTQINIIIFLKSKYINVAIKKKKKLNIIRFELDKLDNSLLKIIQKRTNLVKKVLALKENKNQIVDQKRIKTILKNIRKKSLKNRIDPKITNRIWKNMIWSYIDFERRNFKKK